MADKQYAYLVVAPSYTPDSGGTIFLHKLVHALNLRGERAALVPMERSYKSGLASRVRQLFDRPVYRTNPVLDTPVAGAGDVSPHTVAVYPEMVLGNPLNAPHVARWLLYTPGKRHPYSFGPDDMFFRVDAFADLPEVTGGAPDLFLWDVNPSYRNENRPDRAGACFLVRKWQDGPRHPVTEGAIQIDGKSHAEINEIFNRCDTFYSYDDATMYSQYAAVCGCLSVVIPSGDATRDAMLSRHMLSRYGVAYGLDAAQLAHARRTRHKVLDHLRAREEAGARTVDRFLEITRRQVAARQIMCG